MARTLITTVIAPLTASPFPGGQNIDLIDLATIKDDLQVTGTASDSFLRRGITRASTTAAHYCNRMLPENSFLAQSYQDQVWSHREPYPYSVVGGLAPTLQLGRWPLAGQPSTAGTAPPVSAPILTSTSGGSLPAATYYVRATYVTASGETAASLEASLKVAANNLLQVASPGPDVLSVATGWNVYVSTTSGAETLQNGNTPIALNSGWTEPSAGLITGAALPQAILVIEDANINAATNVPNALTEGIDFTADRRLGQLTRLSSNGQPRHWDSRPLVIQYPAGYDVDDISDVQEAVTLIVKGRLFARGRDPMLKQQSVTGVYDASYWVSAFMDRGAMTPEVTSLLDAYRVPVIG